MEQLFDVDRSVITKHLINIFNSDELEQNAVCAKFAHTYSGIRLPKAIKETAQQQLDGIKYGGCETSICAYSVSQPLKGGYFYAKK